MFWDGCLLVLAVFPVKNHRIGRMSCVSLEKPGPMNVEVSMVALFCH